MRATAEQGCSITAADGVELQAWLAVPARAPDAVLILCHGLTTDADEHGAFPALRDRAVAGGLAVARFDFRGHGRSGGSNQMIRLDGLRADVDAVISLVDAELGEEIPVIPVGLSFGAAPAIHTAATRPSCAGLALWYPVTDYEANYGPRSTVPFTETMRAARDPRRDPEWSAMPVVGSSYHIPSGLLAEMPDDPTPQTLAGLQLPVLAYCGSRDSFIDLEPLRRLQPTHPNIDLRIAYGAGHGFRFWRPWVIHQTVAWAVRIAGARASTT